MDDDSSNTTTPPTEMEISQYNDDYEYVDASEKILPAGYILDKGTYVQRYILSAWIFCHQLNLPYKEVN